MAIVLISYDLITPGKDYKALYDAIKALSGTYSHPLDSIWLVKTATAVKDIRDALQKHVDANDKLLVMQIETPWWAAKSLSKNITDWLTNQVG